MLVLLTVTVSCWLLFCIVCMLEILTGYSRWTFVVLYYALSTLLDRYNLQHMPWLRRCAVASYLGRHWFKTRLHLTQQVFDEIMQCKGPRVFMCGPHGIACVHLAFGFAAYGDLWPESVGARTYVVAHWCFLFIPIVRNIYSAFGVVDSSRATVERVLARGDNLALCPCGVMGKYHAMFNKDIVLDCATKEYKYVCEDDDGVLVFENDKPAVGFERPVNETAVLQRSTSKLGCFKVAAHHEATVWPLLSPSENKNYHIMAPKFLKHISKRHWMLRNVLRVTLSLAHGSWFLFPVQSVNNWYVGAGTRLSRNDGRAKQGELHAFANEVYAAFSDVGEEHNIAVVYDWDKTVHTRHSRLTTQDTEK